MVKISNRFMRISKEFKKNISHILYFNIKDPRIKFSVSVTKIKLTNSLDHIKVFFVFVNKIYKFSIKKTLFLLNRASKYICFLLFKRMYLRIVPNLNFIYDYDFIESIKISNLIKLAIKKDIQKKNRKINVK